MEWKSVRFDWTRVRAFLVTAEEGSLSAAARALGMAQPTLGRQVSALEEEMGVSLFERGPQGLVLTKSGLALLEHARDMGAAATRFSLAASGRAQAIEGSVSITASEIYSAYLLPPIVAELRAAHPGLDIELVSSNDIRDLRRREADIAVRNARPSEPDLVARKVAEDTGLFYAAPAYLERIGGLDSKEDLSKADFVGFGATGELLAGLAAMGLPITRKNLTVQADSHLVHWELVKQGLGVGVAPIWLGDPEPLVVPAVADMEPIRFPVWLIAHREVRTSARVRLVFDHLANALGDVAARSGGR